MSPPRHSASGYCLKACCQCQELLREMIERIAFIVQSSVFTRGISRMIQFGAQAACGVEAASDAHHPNRIEPIGVLQGPRPPEWWA